MKIDKSTAIALVVVFGLGYWYASANACPSPKPKDRPVLRWVVKLAKSALWVALFAEGPPAEEAEPQALARTSVGDDGAPVLEHRGGW